MKLPNRLETVIDCGDSGEIDVEITYDYTPEQRGKFSGPPEDCYPDEPDEISILSMTYPYESRIQMPFEELSERAQQGIFDEIREREIGNARDEQEDYEARKADWERDDA